MFNQSGDTVQLTLDRADVRRIGLLIRRRQEDCKRVTEEFPNYNKMFELDCDLEMLKSRIMEQTI